MTNALSGLTLSYAGKQYSLRITTAKKVRLAFSDREADTNQLIPIISTDCVDLPGLAGYGTHNEYLGPWIAEFMRAIDVLSWEDLQGKPFGALFEDNIIRGVVGIPSGRVFIWDGEFFTRCNRHLAWELASTPSHRNFD